MKTAEAIAKYQKEWHANYKLERKRDREERDALNKLKAAIVTKIITPHYTGNGVVICSHFSCNKQLSITEQLYGSSCINHQPCNTH